MKLKAKKFPPVILLHNIDEKAWSREEIENAHDQARQIEMSLKKHGYETINLPLVTADLVPALNPFDPDKYMIFNFCEAFPGIPHSESSVVRALELLNFSLTGSDSNTLELCWDKKKTKMILDEKGIPTPKWRIYESPMPLSDDWNCFPAIVKPAKEHCSFGVTTDSVVMNRDELRKRISYILTEFSQPALVEDFIDGREFHVTLMGNDDEINILPIAEMDFSSFGKVNDRLCTYDSKFQPDSVHYNKIEISIGTSVELSKKELGELRDVSKRAYLASGCRDYGRIDLRMRNGLFYVLDINVNPDLASDTSTASVAELAGYSYDEMINHILSISMKRHPAYLKIRASAESKDQKKVSKRKSRAAIRDEEGFPEVVIEPVLV